MKSERRRCPIAGCPHTIDAGKLMCRLHWRRVSDRTSRAVTAAWRARRKALRIAMQGDQLPAESKTAILGARAAYEAARDAALAEAARDPGADLAAGAGVVVVDDFHSGPRHE